MCKNCLSCIVRYAQILNMAFGAALCTYGIVFAAKTQGFGIAVGGSLGVGLLEILLATLVFCCVKWLFCLRLNVMIGGLLTLAEFVLAILFLIPSTRNKVIEAVQANADVNAWLTSNVEIFGYVLLVIVGTKLFVIVLTNVEACRVSRAETEDVDKEGSGAELLAEIYSGKGGDKFGALSDEGEGGSAGKYKARHKSMYDKYDVATRK